MRTIRTILATLAVILISYGLVAMSAVNNKAAFAEYSLYSVFSPSNFVALVLGVAFLLVAILLTVAAVSFKDKNKAFDDDEDDMDMDEDDDSIVPLPTPVRRVAPQPYGAQAPDRERALVREEEAITRRMPPVRGAQYSAPAQYSPPPQFSSPGQFNVPAPERVSAPERAAEHAFERPVPPPPAPLPMSAPLPTPVKVPAFCLHCGEPLNGPTQYCPACGKKVTRAD